MLAKKLKIEEARISEILRGKINSFTVDRLLGCAEKLYPSVKIEMAYGILNYCDPKLKQIIECDASFSGPF